MNNLSNCHLFDEDDLLDRLMGDENLAKRVAERFLSDIPAQLASLAAALEQDDASNSRLNAHSIKGAAANAGLLTVRAEAEMLERLGAAGNLQTARQLLPQLLQQVTAATPVLSEFCRRAG